MIPWLGQHLIPIFGPFRLFTSYLFLAGTGTAVTALATWYLLPRMWDRLPTDQGRAHAVGAEQSVGKPVGAGILFIPIYLIASLLFIPFQPHILAALGCVLLSALEGYLDDRKKGGWSEYTLGAMDLGISVLAAITLCGLDDVQIWLPLIKTPVILAPWLYIPLATAMIWLTINATNCSDGVDGLSGSLSTLSFLYMGGILYGIVGHQDIAGYLLVPHYPDGASWALMAFLMVGSLAGYLWHNAYPSAVLMGDAGSRPMGLLIGMLVLASGNPFMIFVVASVMLVNGATGLIKVALLRFLKIGIFNNVRYPLHDHVRHLRGWSNTQVMVRFMLLQAIGTPILLILLFKVR